MRDYLGVCGLCVQRDGSQQPEWMVCVCVRLLVTQIAKPVRDCINMTVCVLTMIYPHLIVLGILAAWLTDVQRELGYVDSTQPCQLQGALGLTAMNDILFETRKARPKKVTPVPVDCTVCVASPEILETPPDYKGRITLSDLLSTSVMPD